MLSRYGLYDLKTDLDLYNLIFDLDPNIASRNRILTHQILNIQTKYRQNHAINRYMTFIHSLLTLDLMTFKVTLAAVTLSRRPTLQVTRSIPNSKTLLSESRLNTDNTMLSRYDLYDLRTDLDLSFDIDLSNPIFVV